MNGVNLFPLGFSFAANQFHNISIFQSRFCPVLPVHEIDSLERKLMLDFAKWRRTISQALLGYRFNLRSTRSLVSALCFVFVTTAQEIHKIGIQPLRMLLRRRLRAISINSILPRPKRNLYTTSNVHASGGVLKMCYQQREPCIIDFLKVSLIFILTLHLNGP